MHYLPFGARLNKGILMVTQLTSGFHGLHLFCSPFMVRMFIRDLINTPEAYNHIHPNAHFQKVLYCGTMYLQRRILL